MARVKPDKDKMVKAADAQTKVADMTEAEAREIEEDMDEEERKRQEAIKLARAQRYRDMGGPEPREPTKAELRERAEERQRKIEEAKKRRYRSIDYRVGKRTRTPDEIAADEDAWEG